MASLRERAPTERAPCRPSVASARDQGRPAGTGGNLICPCTCCIDDAGSAHRNARAAQLPAAAPVFQRFDWSAELNATTAGSELTEQAGEKRGDIELHRFRLPGAKVDIAVPQDWHFRARKRTVVIFDAVTRHPHTLMELRKGAFLIGASHVHDPAGRQERSPAHLILKLTQWCEARYRERLHCGIAVGKVQHRHRAAGLTAASRGSTGTGCRYVAIERIHDEPLSRTAWAAAAELKGCLRIICKHEAIAAGRVQRQHLTRIGNRSEAEVQLTVSSGE
jgi:hypothetical protein